MTEANFEFTIGSDVEFEELYADIGFDNNLVALLTQEDGFENLRIRIFPSGKIEFWDFRLDEFLKVIDTAKKRLWQLRTTTE